MKIKKYYLSDFLKYKNEFKYKSDFKKILSYLCSDNYDKLTTTTPFKKRQYYIFLKILKKYKLGYPIEYQIKRCYFYNRYFYINKKVFIPKWDSEPMIDDICSNDLSKKRIFDAFSGSGALGLSVKEKFIDCYLILSDISNNAIRVCKINSKKYSNVKIIKSDFITELLKPNANFDVLILNPPYISFADNNIEESVKKYQPYNALFSKNEGNLYYDLLFEKIFELYDYNNNVIVYCEFGWKQKDYIENLANGKVNIIFKKDYQNNWRYFIISGLRN